ncbi:MAG: FhaA domain-containing protein [Chloroflexota bacterium]
MKALAQFEEFLQNVVEGSFRRILGGRLEPVDLARRIGRVMDDNKRITWERPLVPNQYAVSLAPRDFAEVQGFVDSLQRELERFVAERAAERGYSLLVPARVTLSAEDALSAGTFQVRATMIDAVRPAAGPAGGAAGGTLTPETPEAPEAYGRTRAMRPLEMPLGPTGFESLCLSGEIGGRRMTWPLSAARLRIGRGLDNDVVLEDASVSRHHAEIVRESGRVEVRDLGSTNGTWVNAGRVDLAAIHPGDQLAFGAVHLEVARRSAA